MVIDVDSRCRIPAAARVVELGEVDIVIYIVTYIIIIEGSLEGKLPTIWTDGKAQPGKSRARKKFGRGENQKGEDKRWRKSAERRCRCAKR